MTENRRPRAPVCGLNRDEATLDTLKSQMPALSRLFDALDAGSTPTFLDMMSAISEMVAFITKERPEFGPSEFEFEKRSLKYVGFVLDKRSALPISSKGKGRHWSGRILNAL